LSFLVRGISVAYSNELRLYREADLEMTGLVHWQGSANCFGAANAPRPFLRGRLCSTFYAPVFSPPLRRRLTLQPSNAPNWGEKSGRHSTCYWSGSRRSSSCAKPGVAGTRFFNFAGGFPLLRAQVRGWHPAGIKRRLGSASLFHRFTVLIPTGGDCGAGEQRNRPRGLNS